MSENTLQYYIQQIQKDSCVFVCYCLLHTCIYNSQALHPAQEDQEVLDLQPHPVKDAKIIQAVLYTPLSLSDLH